MARVDVEATARIYAECMEHARVPLDWVARTAGLPASHPHRQHMQRAAQRCRERAQRLRVSHQVEDRFGRRWSRSRPKRRRHTRRGR